MDSHVIVNSEAHFLKSLVEDYRALLVEIGGHSFDETVFTSQHLQDKLTLVFGQNIKFDHGNKRRGRKDRLNSKDWSTRNVDIKKRNTERKRTDHINKLKRKVYYDIYQ